MRRDIHSHPELGLQETRTSAIVADYFRKLGLEVRTGYAKTGVIGILKGGKPEAKRFERVEIFTNGDDTRKARRRLELAAHIDQHNLNPKPFIWTAKATDILEKVKRGKAALNNRSYQSGRPGGPAIVSGRVRLATSWARASMLTRSSAPCSSRSSSIPFPAPGSSSSSAARDWASSSSSAGTGGA